MLEQFDLHGKSSFCCVGEVLKHSLNRSLKQRIAIIPFDEEMIYESVRKTDRIVIAHEDLLTTGFGAELAARIVANCLDALDAPVRLFDGSVETAR